MTASFSTPYDNARVFYWSSHLCKYRFLWDTDCGMRHYSYTLIQ